MDFAKVFLKFQTAFILFVLPFMHKMGMSNYAFAFYVGFCLIYLANCFATTFMVDKKVLLLGSLCLSWMFFEFVFFGFKGGPRIIQFLTLIFALTVNSKICWKRTDYIFLKRACMLLIIIVIAWLPFSNFQMSRYAAYFSHSNYLGSLMFHVFVILYLCQLYLAEEKKLLFTLFEILVLVLIFISGSRSALLATMVFIILSCIFYTKRNRNSKKIYCSIALLLTISLSCIFTVVYPMLMDTNIGTILELASRRFLNKNFFSGRQILWKNIIEMIKESPFLGYGLDAVPKMYMETSFSSHNYWLQTILQSGFIGFAFFVLFLKRIINQVYLNNYGYVGVSYLCAIIVHECFEVTLTQNEFATGIIVWIVFGTMMAESKKKNVEV